jgi:hypothetical protein
MLPECSPPPPSNRQLPLALLLAVSVGAPACTDVETTVTAKSSPAAADLGPAVSEAHVFLPGLDERITITTHLVNDIALASVQRDTGERTSLEHVKELETAAYNERFGKKTPDFAALLERATPDQVVEVSALIALGVPEPELPDGALDPERAEETPRDFERDRLAYLAWFQARNVASRAAIRKAAAAIEAALRALGVEYQSPTSLPIVNFSIRADLLQRSGLEDLPEVYALAVQANGQSSELGAYAGHASMKETTFTGGSGTGCPSGPCDGGGIGIGIWEEDGVSTSNNGIAVQNDRFTETATYKWPLTTCATDNDCDPTWQNDAVCRAPATGAQKVCVEEHKTFVFGSMGMVGTYSYAAGVVHPNIATFARAGTPNVNPVRVGNDAGDIGLDYILEQNDAPYINHSANIEPDDLAWTIDWAVRNDGYYFFNASGNAAGNDTNWCDHSWNSVCVGSYGLNGRYDLLSQHALSAFSSWVNGAGPERPHLLGPGESLHMPDIGASDAAMVDRHATGQTIGGTSFSSPSILAVAIAYHQYESFLSQLAFPYVNKAVLLAATTDSNNDGAILQGSTWSQITDGKDGAGHPHMERAQDLLNANNYRRRVLTDANFVSCGAGCREYVVATVSVPAQQRIRVSLVWQACQQNVASIPFINNDLDLYVVDSLGALQSSSVNSEVEMVSRKCAAAGADTCSTEIRIRIKGGATLNSCFGSASEPAGIAWVVH